MHERERFDPDREATGSYCGEWARRVDPGWRDRNGAAEPPPALEGNGCPWAFTEGPPDAGTTKDLVCGADETR